jgi:5-methylcytosine-specific restriction endonuclease McrA
MQRVIADLAPASEVTDWQRAKTRRNDSLWRSDVMDKRGRRCRACGGDRDVQSDHLIPRSQCGPSIVENGTPLCGPFGRGCHDRKTAHRLLIRREWLDPDQVAWLELAGHARWLPDGTVAGRHNVLFAAVNDTEE